MSDAFALIGLAALFALALCPWALLVILVVEASGRSTADAMYWLVLVIAGCFATSMVGFGLAAITGGDA